MYILKITPKVKSGIKYLINYFYYNSCHLHPIDCTNKYFPLPMLLFASSKFICKILLGVSPQGFLGNFIADIFTKDNFDR